MTAADAGVWWNLLFALFVALFFGAGLGLASEGRPAWLRGLSFLLALFAAWGVGSLGPDMSGDERHQLMGLGAAVIAAIAYRRCDVLARAALLPFLKLLAFFTRRR